MKMCCNSDIEQVGIEHVNPLKDSIRLQPQIVAGTLHAPGRAGSSKLTLASS